MDIWQWSTTLVCAIDAVFAEKDFITRAGSRRISGPIPERDHSNAPNVIKHSMTRAIKKRTKRDANNDSKKSCPSYIKKLCNYSLSFSSVTAGLKASRRSALHCAICSVQSFTTHHAIRRRTASNLSRISIIPTLRPALSQ